MRTSPVTRPPSGRSRKSRNERTFPPGALLRTDGRASYSAAPVECGARVGRSPAERLPKAQAPSGRSVRWTKAPPTRRDFFGPGRRMDFELSDEQELIRS